MICACRLSSRYVCTLPKRSTPPERTLPERPSDEGATESQCSSLAAGATARRLHSRIDGLGELVAYQVLAEDGTPLDAHFDVDGNTIVFHSRGGTKGKNAKNVDYARGLRLLLQRLTKAGHRVQKAWVDSSRVQAIPIADRTILDHRDAAASSAEQVSRMASRMQAIGRDVGSKSDHGNSTKRIRLQLATGALRDVLLSVIRSVPAEQDSRSEERLPVSELEKVTPEHLFIAVRRLLSNDIDHDFGDSTDYDVLLEDGSRLPPKAVFGLAASEALGFAVKPRHFVGGLKSPCFRILESAGYRVIPKGEEVVTKPEPGPTDLEWSEGSPKLRKHLCRERAPSLREAKKAEFRRTHSGRLFCERCGEDPVAKYKTVSAEACIEVHHAAVQISEMEEGHRTQLRDLQCLCANCHRLVHREMRVVNVH